MTFPVAVGVFKLPNDNTRGKEKPPEQPKKRAYILKNAFKFLHFKILNFKKRLLACKMFTSPTNTKRSEN